MSVLYSIYGLRVRSEIELPARYATEGPADVDIALGALRTVPEEQPAGSPVVWRDMDGRLAAAHVTTPAGDYRMRFCGHAEFWIAGDLSRIVAYPDPASPRGFHAVLLAGEVLAFYLCLRGETVLHASGVSVGGRLLGLLGASGQGKSSLSARLCAHGARLVSDDVMRVSQAERSILGWPGTTAIRLRPPAQAIAQPFDTDARLQTPDDRIAVYPNTSGNHPLDLAALAIPYPDREIDTPCITRLSIADALQTLIRYPRILGWQTYAVAARDFPVLANIARSLPVLAARVPWGEHYVPAVADQLLEQLVPGGQAAG